MEGMCKCGGRISESNHMVTTDAGASSYVEPMSEYRIPLSIDADNKLFAERG